MSKNSVTIKSVALGPYSVSIIMQIFATPMLGERPSYDFRKST